MGRFAAFGKRKGAKGEQIWSGEAPEQPESSNVGLRLTVQIVREPSPTNASRNCPVFLRFNKVVTPVLAGVN
jgi:hypothetical protein